MALISCRVAFNPSAAVVLGAAVDAGSEAAGGSSGAAVEAADGGGDTDLETGGEIALVDSGLAAELVAVEPFKEALETGLGISSKGSSSDDSSSSLSANLDAILDMDALLSDAVGGGDLTAAATDTCLGCSCSGSGSVFVSAAAARVGVGVDAAFGDGGAVDWVD